MLFLYCSLLEYICGSLERLVRKKEAPTYDRSVSRADEAILGSRCVLAKVWVLVKAAQTLFFTQIEFAFSLPSLYFLMMFF